MLNYLKSHFFPTTIIPLIIFTISLKKINTISGTDSEIFDSSSGSSSNDGNICPCDMTEGVCDNGCYCDKDCLNFLLSDDYFNNFKIDESSYTEKNIDSKLDYCNDYLESVDDLYNPLVLAFKILKRGFCLVNQKDREDEEDTEDYDKSLEYYESNTDTETDDEYKNKFDKYIDTLNNFNDDLRETANFKESNIFLPISLPNGLCLFHSYQLRKNIDYEVTCSYDKYKRENVISEFSCSNFNQYLINDNYYIYTEQAITTEHYLKKVEILYYNQPKNNINPLINCYYEASDVNNKDYKDLTIEVKFVLDENDFKLSGNPGYIKGKQIIFANENDNVYNIYSKGIIFPIENPKDTSPKINEGYIYFDNYMDNKITFEDLIIYGYDEGKYLDDFINLIKLEYTPLGNGKKLDQKLNNININNDDNKNNFVLIGEYKDSGSVNNTQFQIHSLRDGNRLSVESNQINTYTSYKYFIIKFVKLETETEWYYARSPVIIKLPKNIMYPFKIGTSKYKR